ncbi:hypothetical protein JNW90_10530 [Micromonospora sp. STR1s_5]|nr:hypothetical protein [Micromonospora sp. STR1s_5]
MSVDPHPVDEDPEAHIGPEIPDPWDDPKQTDWPQANNSTAGEVSN